MGDGQHRYEGVEAKPGGFVARCACGWRSRLVGTAGTAGPAWDQHAGLVFNGKAHLWIAVTTSGSTTKAALAGELERRRPIIESLVAEGTNYRRALAEAAGFGPAVDRFFTDVFVMVDDQALRRARLRLMKRLARLILSLADISEIVPHTE